MRKNILSKAVLILWLFAAFGCKTRRLASPVTASPQSAVKPSFSKEEVINQLTLKQANFNTLTIRAKADLNINNKNNDVSMQIRMQRGEVIWISVSFPVIGEIARTLITPDSIKIINKFENTYTRKPFSYIHQFVSQQVDINTLQDIFTGRAIEGTLSPKSELSLNGGQARLQGDLAGVVYSLIFNENKNLIQSNLKENQNPRTLTLNYSEYSNVSGQEIPTLVSIKSEVSEKNINMDLKYNNIELNTPTEFPFNVPKRFTVRD